MNKSVSQKLNKCKTSPLIIGIAVLEVIVLICVSTYAWFVFADNNQVNTDIISVEPDSGLEIDFSDANENDYVNIWNYLKEFQFEPVTSLDGRNIFIPTTGTFNAYAGDVSPDTPSSPENPGDTQNTYLIYFDTKGTGWDTPYIECDFTYGEGDNIAMTRLNSTSTIYYYDLAPLLNKYNTMKLTYMKFKNGKGADGVANITNMFGTKYNCIYPILLTNYLYKCELDSNDKAIQGEQANHYGLMVLEPEPYSGTVPDIGGSDSGNSGSGDGTGAVSDKGGIKFREATVNDMNSKYINIDFTLTNNGTEAMPVYLSSNSYFNLYDPDTKESIASKAIRIAFYQNDGESGRVASTLLSKEYEGDTPEDPDDPGGGTGGSTYTVYLDPPSEWTDASQIRAYVFGTSGSPFSFPGEVMQYDSSTGYYYYTADRKYNKVIFNYHGNQNQTVNLDVYDQGIYVLDDGRNGTWALDHIQQVGGTKVEDDGTSGSGSGNSGNTGESEGQTTVYFNNTLGWKQPYAYIWRENDNNDEELSAWPGKPMTHISGSIYYYTFNSKYDSIIFNDGNAEGGAIKTQDISPVKDGYIYMIGNSTGDNEFGYTQEDYIGTVNGGTYPVISPGVSTGFQRPYAPVTQIDDNTGKPRVVVPAFASSIDDYNYGSEHSLFTIEPGQTLPLSMIIWLEGTDPDCTEDVYTGKFIDMKLVFATKDSGDKMYTYKFLDKTKENWIDDKITTDTGVSFKPVIQLYDANSGKGYQMSVHDDEAGNPTIWQCSAPEALVNSDHIMFRRVNPMNEDEVWNYWDTSGFEGKDGAVVDSTVYFSAFSDGAPTNALMDANATESSGAPLRSCGGLWGNHETKILTIYDGTEGQWIKNSIKQDTSSVLTMNYTYDGQTVEYKASGSGNDMYYFVVPKAVYSKTVSPRPNVTFKRYYNFDSKYALNSDKNELTYHMKWSTTPCDGLFGQITGNGSGDFYWGSDLIYVQARNAITSKISGSHLQVHFYSNENGEEVSNTSHYTTLYRNDNFAAKNDGYGYACVVPSNKTYYKYRVERCDPSNTSAKWNITPLQDLSTSSTDADFTHLNTASNNICTIDYMFLKVYLECSTDYCGDSWDPEIYVFKEGGSNENQWPGTSMTWVKNGSEESSSAAYKQYVYDVNISSYDRIVFSNDYDYGNQRRQTGDITIGSDDHVSGMIYQWDSSNQKWRSTRKTGITPNETLHVTLYNTPDWP